MHSFLSSGTKPKIWDCRVCDGSTCYNVEHVQGDQRDVQIRRTGYTALYVAFGQSNEKLMSTLERNAFTTTGPHPHLCL